MQAPPPPPPNEARGAAAAAAPQQQQHRSRIPWTKVFIIAALVGLCLVLQFTTWTLQFLIAMKRQEIANQNKIPPASALASSASASASSDSSSSSSSSSSEAENNSNNDSNSNNNNNKKDTIPSQSTSPTQRKELHHLYRKSSTTTTAYQTGASLRTAAAAYWNQALQQLDWDGDDDDDAPALLLQLLSDSLSDDSVLWTTQQQRSTSSSSSRSRLEDDSRSGSGSASSGKNATAGIVALKRAAAAGHPTAQYYVANALAAGFWPWPVAEQQQDNNKESSSSSSSSEQKTTHDDSNSKTGGASTTMQQQWDHLQVLDTWTDGQNEQLNQAWLLWHMAAMGGNIEAAMALATRLEFTAKQEATKTITTKEQMSDLCERRLPYIAAAAHGIVDLLEADPNSRAQVVPAQDKHVLYQVHLHGGTGSRLDKDNRPDESPDALQYYHVRATDAIDEGEAARAASTLAQLYHNGFRGAPQNLTLALKYYERAGYLNHWEAAGQAGMMYLWGIGTKQDPNKAHKLFKVGILDDFETCRSLLDRKLKQGKSGVSFALCEKTCLTGMGLLYLLGVPLFISVDQEMATKYFKLAKEQGDVDALYYLAMMKLGWKTHYQPIVSMEEGGQTLLEDLHFPKSDDAVGSHPTTSEYQSILTDLTTAANKGHLKATHRLGMMYENGISVPNGNKMSQVISRDCEKASKHYKSVISASPHRARRIRRAYKQYMTGDTSKSLRNYLFAAESGSNLALLNAAFLMEQGECVGLNRIDCAKASVRLWKAAAVKGYSEASLRVGDFYYYGRFRGEGKASHVGKFAWIWYLVYPEELLPRLREYAKVVIRFVLSMKETKNEETKDQVDAVCRTGGEEGTCNAGDITGVDDDAEHTIEKDLASAAQYYRMAAERNPSPRAHFNLGFLYEWGLGLKQDFPLAKRHYDLAISTGPEEAGVPATIALLSLRLHEYVVKQWMAWNDWVQKKSIKTFKADIWEVDEEMERKFKKTKQDVLFEHLLTWESLLLLILTLALWMLLQVHFNRTNR